MSNWIKISEQPPKDGAVVWTKISDNSGDRNEQQLQKRGGLWFVKDGSMYVYYTPTHWRP